MYCEGLEWKVQRESKEEERKDSKVSEASSLDSWEDGTRDGSDDRTDEANVAGERFQVTAGGENVRSM